MCILSLPLPSSGRDSTLLTALEVKGCILSPSFRWVGFPIPSPIPQGRQCLERLFQRAGPFKRELQLHQLQAVGNML